MRMNTQLMIIIFLLFVSCKQDLLERHYKSQDEATGGFNIFSLDLYSNGKLELTIETSIVVEEKETGTVWETQSKKVMGKWDIQNEVLNCSLDEPKTSIDSIFINTDFSNFTNKSLLAFSQKSDTAYIYGIPCIKVDTK